MGDIRRVLVVGGGVGGLTAAAPRKTLTGDVWFDGTHARGDRGVLYTVTPDGTGGFSIRATR